MVFPCGEESENGQPPLKKALKIKKFESIPFLRKVLKGCGKIFSKSFPTKKRTQCKKGYREDETDIQQTDDE